MEFVFLRFYSHDFWELTKLVKVDVLGHYFWNDAC